MTLDSNIIIALLDKEESVVAEISRFQEMGFTFFLPTVVESEVLSYSKWADSERHIVEKFLEENFTSVPFDRPLARIVAKMRRETKIKTPDAIIAATALLTRTPLIYQKPQRLQKHTGTSPSHNVRTFPLTNFINF